MAMNYPEGFPKKMIYVDLDYRYNSGIDYFTSSLGKRSCVFAWEPEKEEPDGQRLLARVLANADLLIEDHKKKLTAAASAKESLKNVSTEALLAALEERTQR